MLHGVHVTNVNVPLLKTASAVMVKVQRHAVVM